MMKKHIALIFAIISSSFFVLGQNPDRSTVHELTIQGIDKLYNLEIEESERVFDEVIRIAPDDPRGHFFKSMVFFWMYNLTKDEAAYKKFFEMSDKVIEICDVELDKDENNGLAKYYLGGAYGFRGLAYQRNGSTFSAAWDGKKGYSYLKEATKDSPEVYDAQFGFGLFNYLVAKVPRGFRWLLSILGFKGDLEGGLESMRIAAEKGTYARNEATFFLATFLFNEEREDEALKYLKRIMDKYPENSLFLVTFAQWQLRRDNIDSALMTAQRAVEINARRKIKFGDEFAHNVLSTCYFTRNNFEQARVNIELSIEKTDTKKNISNATYYRLGMCYDLLGERDKALGAYRQLKKADLSSNPWEYQSYRLGQKRIKSPPNEIDRMLVKASNHQTVRAHKEALTIFKAVVEDSSANVDQRAIALYAVVQIKNEQKEYEEVIATAKQLASLSPPNELWLVPHGLFRLGQAYARTGRNEEARLAFDSIDEFDDYDFQDRLETRVEEELEKLKNK